MAHFLDASQLAEACTTLDLDEHARAIEAACQAAGEAIAAKLGIALISDASNQPGFGGLCVGFGPATEGQKVPSEIADFDSGSDWAEEALGDEEGGGQ